MAKSPRWTAECDNAATFAKAIVSGVLTDKLSTLKEFLDPESTGPGAAIGFKYDYHTVAGKQNITLNWKKLVKKIGIWKSNKPDPETGKCQIEPTQPTPTISASQTQSNILTARLLSLVQRLDLVSPF